MNSNISVFKNFAIGGGKRIQFRWEMYNVFNQVNWSAINTNAQFNPAGEQVNANFGKATPRATRASCRGRSGSRSDADEMRYSDTGHAKSQISIRTQIVADAPMRHPEQVR